MHRLINVLAAIFLHLGNVGENPFSRDFCCHVPQQQLLTIPIFCGEEEEEAEREITDLCHFEFHSDSRSSFPLFQSPRDLIKTSLSHSCQEYNEAEEEKTGLSIPFKNGNAHRASNTFLSRDIR